MSDERKEWLLKHIDYVFGRCMGYNEHLNSDCLNCLEGNEACDEARMELRRLIQQKPDKTTLALAKELEVEPWKVMQIAKWAKSREKPEIDETEIERLFKEVDIIHYYKDRLRKFAQIIRGVGGGKK